MDHHHQACWRTQVGGGSQTSAYEIRDPALENWPDYALRPRQSQSPDRFQTGRYGNTTVLWELIVEVGRGSKCETLMSKQEGQSNY
jgi:hypothetical protein